MVGEGIDDLLAFTCAHAAGIDKDTGELIANGAMHEQGRDGGIDAARKPADDTLFTTYALANALNGFVNN